jgi:DNA-binding GntR family transcriptional regulator
MAQPPAVVRIPRPPDRIQLTTGPTLAGQAYQVLRDDITMRRLPPGERITERGLAERLGISPTPVREALRRLEHERLVERIDKRSLVVADPPIAQMIELTRVEAALRGVAARLATANASNAELEQIRSAYADIEALEATPIVDAAEYAAVLPATRRFHRLIDEASHNPMLIDMIATATAFDERFRLHTYEVLRERSTGSDWFGHRLRQHRPILDALLARDGDRAEETMREHILYVSDLFLDVLGDEAATE